MRGCRELRSRGCILLRFPLRFARSGSGGHNPVFVPEEKSRYSKCREVE